MTKTNYSSTKTIDVLDLCKENQLNIVNKDLIKEWAPITRPAINRVGLELLGHFFNDDLDKNIIGWGTTESKLMDSIDEKDLKINIAKIFDYKPPLVICSVSVKERNINIIRNIADEKGIPLVITENQLSFTTTTVGIYIAEKFALEEFIHSSLVIINGIGVLIIGDSGIGKSEAVLEIIQKGHIFVSDDSVLIKRVGNEFIGCAPEITKNILEARGLGLIDIKQIYGERVIKDKANIQLVVELKSFDNNSKTQFDRLGNENHFFEVLGGKINKIIIPVRPGRNMASLIEVATNLFVSKQNGTDPLKTIQERM